MEKKTAAELALQKKYELLRKKKEQASKGAGGQKPAAAQGASIGAVAPKTTTAPAAATAPSAPVPTARKQTSASNNDAVKVKVVIPKRQVTTSGATTAPTVAVGGPSTGTTTNVQPSTNNATTTQEPAAAAAITTAHTTTAPQQPPLQQLKRPTLKRPTARRPPASTSQPQTESQQDDGLNTYNDNSQEPAAKRWQSEEGSQPPHFQPTKQDPYDHQQQQALPSQPCLFVGNLPGHFSQDMLWNLFSEFGQVTGAHVVTGYNYGFVTFTSFDEAQAMLEFQERQPIEVEDRQLQLSWAQGDHTDDGAGTQGGAGGLYDNSNMIDPHGHHPMRMEARSMAQQVARQMDDGMLYAPPPSREMVTYDDL